MNKFLRHFRNEIPQFSLPGRVYGRLSEIESLATDETGIARTELLFECIEAVWAEQFDPMLNLPDTSNWPISILELVVLREHANIYLKKDAPLWWNITFGAGELVVHFLNLHTAGVERLATLEAVEKASAIERALEEQCQLDKFDDASEQEIESALSSLGHPSAAMAYDCGQRNWNALIDTLGAPNLYFDCGAGVLRHSGTVPTALVEASICRNPVIVLSHWDWDHWSFATRDRRYASNGGPITCTWIIPRQRLGHVHRTLLGDIKMYGHVLVWPATTSSVAQSGVRLEKCLGKGRNRNHSGIAMMAIDSSKQEMLFPGDARYTSIPSVVAGKHFLSVVATHHGAAAPSGALASSASASGRVVYSYGTGNRYHHPNTGMVARMTALWPNGLETPHVRPTPGHVELHWSSTTPAITMPATCTCGNTPVQR